MVRKLRDQRLRHGPKYPGITANAVETEQSANPKLSPHDLLSPHDRKELARYVRKYGREAVIAAAKTIPLPRKQHRPPHDNLDREFARETQENIAWFLYTYEEKHRLAGSKKPLQRALNDLYWAIGKFDRRHEPGYYKRWCDTQLRKCRSVRRAVIAREVRAKETAKMIEKRYSKVRGRRKKRTAENSRE